MRNKLPLNVAAIDLGSNSFHMIVCSLTDGKLQTIDSLKEMVRLASGLNEQKILDDDTQKRALACLEKFGQRIRNFPPGSVRVVGTNTLRTAKNSAQFLVQAEQALSYPIEVISGMEEARLIYLGVAYSLSSNANLRLVIDIGGGSTEYIIGTGENPKEKESLYMGCVSVSNLFFKDGLLSKQSFAEASLFAEQQLEPFQKKFQSKRWDEAIGASGSLRSIAKVLAAKNWSNNGITREGLEKLVCYLQQYRHINELNLPDLNPDRLPVFVGGVAIIHASFKMLGIEQMTIADGALREGVIQDLLGRLYDHDSRSTTVQALVERYRTDKHHAARIKHTAATLLAQLSNDHLWADDEHIAQFLYWAADLHEIGNEIAHNGYHKHGAYIIENGDLAGFSTQDQKILAAIIRNHRRKFSRTSFSALAAPWNTQAIYLTIVLRLAVLLRRNRYEYDLPDFKISLIKNKLSLEFPADWLRLSPLTHADLIQEADYLKYDGFRLDFS